MANIPQKGCRKSGKKGGPPLFLRKIVFSKKEKTRGKPREKEGGFLGGKPRSPGDKRVHDGENALFLHGGQPLHPAAELGGPHLIAVVQHVAEHLVRRAFQQIEDGDKVVCLLYTSDAADER